jgi:transposase
MNKYTNFFGVDTAKSEFVTALHGQKTTNSFANAPEGFIAFADQFQEQLEGGLVIIETTGGYEWELIAFLNGRGIAVHRADTVKVKSFIKSLRRFGKTDAIDARGLAMYGYERHSSLTLFQVTEDKQFHLQLLMRRRDELVNMRIQELNRSQGPLSKLLPIASSFSNILAAFDSEIDIVEKAMQVLIESDPIYDEKKKLMLRMPGIGEITANKLLALVPELGTMTRRGIASISGVAPHPYDSGKINGYRRTRGGRPDVKKALFMAAMAACRTKGKLGDYYRKLLERGKKGKVALVALMRKILVILNGQMRNLLTKGGTVLLV